jgi:SEC-C motif
MHISFSALNRLAELRTAELRLRGEPVPKSRGCMLSDALLLSDDQLLQRLRDVGIEQDRVQLQSLVQRHCSAEEIAKEFLKHWRPGPGQDEWTSQWIWFAHTILWERWFPEVPSFERIDDNMQRGYALKDQAAQCERWIGVWDDIVHLREKIQTRSLAEFDDRFGGTQSLFNWIQDFEIALANAALDQDRFYEMRARICSEFLSLFEEADSLIQENTRRAWAESVHALGDEALSESLFRSWLEADPEWGWGWIGWSDLHSCELGSANVDLVRAEAILQEGLALRQVRNREDIVERLATVYRDQGRTEEALKLERLTAPAPAGFISIGRRRMKTLPLPSGTGDLPYEGWTPIPPSRNWGQEKLLPPTNTPREKVGRNDPCPCGSGKKYKRCCGG